MRLEKKSLEITRNLIKRMKDDTEASVSIEAAMNLVDTIEALQQENNGWRERYDELDAGHSRLFKDFCKLQQENEQLRARVARMREALHYCAYASGISKPHSQVAQQALAEIDKAIGGKEDE